MKREMRNMIALSLIMVSVTLFATPKKESSARFTETYIKEIEKDVKLTPAQRDSLQLKLAQYADRLQDAREISDKAAANQMMIAVQQELAFTVTSIIGEENAAKRTVSVEKRRKEKIDAIKSKHQKK